MMSSPPQNLIQKIMIEDIIYARPLLALAYNRGVI